MVRNLFDILCRRGAGRGGVGLVSSARSSGAWRWCLWLGGLGGGARGSGGSTVVLEARRVGSTVVLEARSVGSTVALAARGVGLWTSASYDFASPG